MSALAIPEPSTLSPLQLRSACEQAVAWSRSSESVDEVWDTTAKFAAIKDYFKRTSTEGAAEIEATTRRLEVRIGELLGEALAELHAARTTEQGAA